MKRGVCVKAFELQDRPPSSPPAEHNASFRVVRRFRAWRRVGIVVDAFAILAAAAIAISLECHDPLGSPARFWRYGSLSQVPAWKLGTAFLSFVVVLLWTSSHDRDSAFRKRSLLEEQRLNLQDCAVSAVFLAGVLYLLGADAVSHALVLWLLVWATVGLALRRWVFRAFTFTYAGSRNVLIIGTDSAACTLREQLRDGAGVHEPPNRPKTSCTLPGSCSRAKATMAPAPKRLHVSRTSQRPPCSGTLSAKRLYSGTCCGPA